MFQIEMCFYYYYYRHIVIISYSFGIFNAAEIFQSIAAACSTATNHKFEVFHA